MSEPLTPERVQDLQQRWNAIMQHPSLAAYEALVGDLWDALDAARLSHDRGADALQEAARDVRQSHAPNGMDYCVTCRTSWPCDAEMLAELVVTRAALSVPAPTLPALDAETLADAMADPLTFALMEDMRAGRIPGRWEQVADIMVERHPRLREALRDAV